MKKIVAEFKNFAVKGNMVDMAIGIIIGTAFSDVVDALVKKLLLPPLSLLTDGVNLQHKKIILRTGTKLKDEVAIGYGAFAEVLFDFVLVALSIFVVLKIVFKLRDKADNPEDNDIETPKEIELLARIEKLMQAQNRILENKNNEKN